MATPVPLLPWQAQGVVKDLDADLLQHLAQGTAFLQVSTKAHPHGEMRGRVGPQLGRALRPIPTTAWGPQPGDTAQSGGVEREQGGSHAVAQSWQPGVVCTVAVGACSTNPAHGGQPGVGMGSRFPPAVPTLLLHVPVQVHIPNRCHAGGTRLAPGEAELSEGTKTRDLEQLKKDPNSCFFEGQHRAHGTRWAPDYDKKCSICSCQVRAGWGGAPWEAAPASVAPPVTSPTPAVPRSAQ